MPTLGPTRVNGALYGFLRKCEAKYGPEHFPDGWDQNPLLLW
jgi:hypothetical protein